MHDNVKLFLGHRKPYLPDLIQICLALVAKDNLQDNLTTKVATTKKLIYAPSSSAQKRTFNFKKCFLDRGEKRGKRI